MSRPKLRHNQLIYLLLLTLVTIAASQSSHQQHFSHAPTNEDTSRAFNLTELLITRFPYLFKDITIPNLSSENQNDSSNYQSINHNNDTNHQQQQQQPQSTLENRKIDQPPSGRPTILSNEASFRNYFRILDKVFSRVTLPEVYRSSRSKLGAHCGLHIGCLEELPNFPALLKKANITSTYTLYSGDKASRAGHKIHYEPITHYQLQDAYTSEIDLEEKLRAIQRANLAATQQQQQQLLKNNRRTHHHHHVGGNRLSMIQKQQRQQLHSLNPLIHAAAAATQPLISPKLTAHSWRSATKILHSQEYPFDLASLESSGFNASQNTRVIIGGYFAKEDEEWIDEVVRQWLILEPQSNVIKVSWAEANRGLYHTAAYNSRIVGRQMSLFLHYLDQLFNINLNKFHLVGHSLGAHIAGFVGSDFDGRIARITGLDPAGPIFVELNASMRLDPSDSKFVDVMHTNGGTITKGSLGLSIPSGHVDYYCNGGSVQPGCYFSSVTKSIMDPVERIACNHRRSYRYFLEIIKMTIRATQNSDTFGISQPVDQVSKQATVITTNSTLDSNLGEFSDDDRLVAARRQVDCDDDTCSSEELSPKTVTINRSLPSAFLFEAKQDDLVRLIQPEISLMRADLGSNEDQLPVRRHIEFHLLNPTFPPGKRGTYFFKTRSEAPFFGKSLYGIWYTRHCLKVKKT